MSKDCNASKSYCRTNRNASHSASQTAQHQTYVRRLVRSKVPNIFSRSEVGKNLVMKVIDFSNPLDERVSTRNRGDLWDSLVMQQSINQIIIAPRGIRLFCASPSWLNLRPFHERKNVHGTENPSLRSVISAWEDPVHKEKMAACTMADRLVRNVNRDFPSF